MTLKKQIQNLVKKNPNITTDEIVKRTGASKNYAYLLGRKWKLLYGAKAAKAAAETEAQRLEREKAEAKVAEIVQKRNEEVRAKKYDVDNVLAERAKEYGRFADQAQITQALRNTAHRFANDHGKVFTADQALALDMILVKLGRILSGNPNHLDSWLDIAGYARLVSDRMQGVMR